MSRSDDILEFIREELLDDDELEIDVESSLFAERILDSLNLLSLVGWLESTYGVKIGNTELNIDNLDTVTRIIGFLERKGA